MDKEKILSKITPKDYPTELETILENKDFSEDAKNLLLSCVYKIEDGYSDYEIVKQTVVSKKEYLEEILNIIKNKCKGIEIKKEPTKEIENNTKARYEVDRFEGKITIWHPNEKTLLYAIYELDDNQIYVHEKYSLIRTALSELLNKGENINRLEVLRDFNGWNWNTALDEMQDITINLVYQNLISLLGIEFMQQWVHSEKVKDYLELAKQEIQNKFGKENEEELFLKVSKLALSTCIRHNQKERQYLLEEKKQYEEEYEKLNNKRELLEEISKHKKEAFAQIKEIDTILNDKKLLQEEFIKRNEKLPEYHKIFSLGHLTEKLTKQRKKIMMKMEEENKLLEPAHYVEAKTKLEEILELLSCLELSEEQMTKKVIEDSIELQKVVMKCLKKRIQEIDKKDKSQKKEECVKEIYRFRYYNYLYLENHKCIGQIEELEKEKREIESLLFQKAEELKCTNKIAKDGKDFDIFNILFHTRIMNLENIIIEFQEQEEIELFIYETDILEKKISLDIQKEDLMVKLDKKMKLLG